MSDIEKQITEAVRMGGRYKNSTEKAEDHKSSALTLLIVGITGMVLLSLLFFDVIQFKGINKYMTCGVMGALFVLFIVMGLISLKNYKLFAQAAEGENQLTDEIFQWCRDNLTAELIDSGLSFLDETDEAAKYFVRNDRIREFLKEKFMNLDDEFLDHMMDEIYPFLYGDTKEEDDA